jgi:hypothetical protein
MQLALLALLGTSSLALIILSAIQAWRNREGQEWLTFLAFILLIAAILWPMFTWEMPNGHPHHRLLREPPALHRP